MKKILEIALEAEQKAQNIAENAMREKERCDKSIANADKISEEYLKKAKERIAEFEEREKLKAQVQVEKLDKELSLSMDRLEKLYKTHGDKWIDAMYREITETL